MPKAPVGSSRSGAVVHSSEKYRVQYDGWEYPLTKMGGVVVDVPVMVGLQLSGMGDG